VFPHKNGLYRQCCIAPPTPIGKQIDLPRLGKSDFSNPFYICLCRLYVGQSVEAEIIIDSWRFFMKKSFTQTRGLLFLVGILLVLFWLGLESEVFARAGGGRSSGSRGYSSGGSYQRSPGATPAPQQRDYQQPRQQPQPPPASAGRSFLSGMAGGLVGGLLGGMLFRSLGFAGGLDGGGGFGFGDILLILIILGIIYFLVKRFRGRQALQMSAAGAGSLP